MFSSLKKYELLGAKRRVRLFNRFRIESVLKNRALSHAEIWWYREIGVSLHCRSKKGCTRQSLSKLSSVLVCTFFAL